MKRNTPNSQDKNRNDHNNRNKNGRDSKVTSKNASKECIDNACKAANSCASANKTVDEIERYTRKAENLVEALSALTRLAEQLKPCITTNNSQPGIDTDSDISSIDADVVQSDDDDEEDSEPNIPAVKKRQAPTPVPKVRSAPERVKPHAENPESRVCYCSSLHQNKINFKDDKPNKEKEKQKVAPEKPAKKKSTEIIYLKPLPMPSMTVVQPVENPKALTLQPLLIYNNPIEDNPVKTYPTVAAITTKAALNLEDKQVQTVTENRTEMGSMTDPVRFVDDIKTEDGTTCCSEDCMGGNVDATTDEGATTLNAIPFEEYAEKDCSQYWYDDAVHCKCSSTTDIDSKHTPLNTPAQYQQSSQSPTPTNMKEYYPYNHGNQQNPQPNPGYRQFPEDVAQPNYAGSRNSDPKDPGSTKPMYNDHAPAGMNGVNYLPPERIVYKACRAKGPAIDSATLVFEEIECIPICKNAEPQNCSYAGGPSCPANRTPPPNAYQNRPQRNNKKVVQYDNQQYDYYLPEHQRNCKIEHEIHNIDSYPPYYENTPQMSRVRGGPQESNCSNRTFGRPTAGSQQQQLNNRIGQNYKTLLVDKPDKGMKERIKKSDIPEPNADQCSGLCTYHTKTTNKKK